MLIVLRQCNIPLGVEDQVYGIFVVIVNITPRLDIIHPWIELANKVFLLSGDNGDEVSLTAQLDMHVWAKWELILCYDNLCCDICKSPNIWWHYLIWSCLICCTPSDAEPFTIYPQKFDNSLTLSVPALKYYKCYEACATFKHAYPIWLVLKKLMHWSITSATPCAIFKGVCSIWNLPKNSDTFRLAY